MAGEANKNRILWAKGLFNGLLAWLLGFFIYMIPAFAVAIKMGVELGPKTEDSQAVSEKISRTISEMYSDNLLLMLGFILVTGLLILWRSGSVSGKASGAHIANGLLVSVFPVLFSLIVIISTEFGLISIIELLFFTAMGYLGGNLSGKRISK